MASGPVWLWPVVVVILVAVNLLNGLWWPAGYLITAPVATAVLVGVGLLAGLSWRDLGLAGETLGRGLVWGAVAVAVVALGYLAAAALPAAEGAAGPVAGGRAGVARALAEVTVGTVPLEETAFRGVLWGLVGEERGPVAATVVTSLLFGLWHVVPSLTDTGVRRPAWLVSLPAGGTFWTGGTVLLTALAGVLFAELRRRSGSLLAPMGLHWATNALGVVFRVAVHSSP